MPLPAGVTVAEWSLERTRWQNPRIRAFLGCIRLLGSVMESNYALLHCSPERLSEIWKKVRKVADLMLTELAPLLDHPSPIPELESARGHAEDSLTLLADTVLADLERFPQEVAPEQMIEVRKLLCVSIGKIHAFLQDTFGLLMASDPRSQYDADYFLSRRFPQDVEEAEWLYTTVVKLREYLTSLEDERRTGFGAMSRQLRTEQALPLESTWAPTERLLERLADELTPKLKSILALRGIRFHEMEIVDRYAQEIPTSCRLAAELYAAGRATADRMRVADDAERPRREQNVRDLVVLHADSSERVAQLLGSLDSALADLLAFVPIWLDGIGRRRALLLRRIARDEDDETNGVPDELDRPGASRDGSLAADRSASLTAGPVAVGD